MQVSVEKRASVNSETDLFAVLTTSINSEKWRLPPRWSEIDGWLDGSFKRVVDLGDFNGKAGQIVRLYSKERNENLSNGFYRTDIPLCCGSCGFLLDS